MLGIMGTTTIPQSGRWWKGSSDTFVMSLYQNAVLNILESISHSTDKDFVETDCIDGIFMATSYDVPWREDIFDGWHFYDISQCYEFHRKGLTVGGLCNNVMTVIHETTLRNNDNPQYNRYLELFLKEYINN